MFSLQSVLGNCTGSTKRMNFDLEGPLPERHRGAMVKDRLLSEAACLQSPHAAF